MPTLLNSLIAPVRTIHRRQFLPLTPEQAWRYFATPVNLEAMTPDFLRFQITSEIPDVIFDGLIITYHIAAIGGVPMTWVTEIKHVVPGHQFVDEQRVGPFRFWYHEHRFVPMAGGIEMIDLVHYVMPWGPVGELAHSVFVDKRLKEIFDFRSAYLSGLFGGRPAEDV